MIYKEKLWEVIDKFNNELELDKIWYKLLEDEKENLEKNFLLKVE